jgi:hypothetical protein
MGFPLDVSSAKPNGTSFRKLVFIEEDAVDFRVICDWSWPYPFKVLWDGI